jgi:imidazoleglycerol-phosphate dehydratase
MSDRTARIERQTSETNVLVELAVDGSGASDISTGVRMLDHFLTQIARHGLFDIKVAATGDDQHHLAEDVAMCLGKALNEALGEKVGIVRMAHAMVPMDEALSVVAIDISGRGGAVIDAPLLMPMIGDLESDMVRHFLGSFASEARLTLHARVECGVNDHHKAEALFKALACALRDACSLDPRRAGIIPSSKGVLEQ